MSVDIHPTSHTRRHRAPTRGRSQGRWPASSPGSLAAGVTAALVLTLVVFAGGTESVITGSLLARVRVRVGADRRRSPAATPAARSAGPPSRRSHGRHRPRAAGVHPRIRRHDPAELGVAAGHAGDRGLDVRPDAPAPDRRAAAGCSPRSSPSWRSRRVGATYENVSPRAATRTPSPPPARRYEVGGHRLHLDCRGPRRPHRRALQRHGRDLRLLGQDRRPGRAHHPGLRLRPRRTGLERGRRSTPRTASPRPRTCTRCSPRPASTAPSCWSDTRPAAPTR